MFKIDEGKSAMFTNRVKITIKLKSTSPGRLFQTFTTRSQRRNVPIIFHSESGECWSIVKSVFAPRLPISSRLEGDAVGRLTDEHFLRSV